MGKALVIDGITISNPVRTVTFSGVGAEVLAYAAKISSTLSDSQQESIQSFIDTLKDNGLWESVEFFYPMYGSAADCAYGIVGDDLTLPTGTAYDKGLNLNNATGGGAGACSKGIILSSDFLPDGSLTNVSLFYNNPYTLSYNTQRVGDVFVLCDTDVAESSTGTAFGVSNMGSDAYRYTGMGYVYKDYTASDDFAKGVKAFHFNATDQKTRIYEGGAWAAEATNSSINTYKRLGINTWPQSSHNLIPSVNLLLGYNSVAITESQMITISGALSTLSTSLGLIS